MENQKYIWAILRISMGWIFLWAFLDKLLGLGFSTSPQNSWIAGGSPTYGFLSNTKGVLSPFFQSLSNSVLIEWLFMLGLLFVGLTLILGVLVKLGSYSGALMMFLIWLSVIPPTSNPFLDSHIIYILVLIGISLSDAGKVFGFGKFWASLRFIKKHPILK